MLGRDAIFIEKILLKKPLYSKHALQVFLHFYNSIVIRTLAVRHIKEAMFICIGKETFVVRVKALALIEEIICV